MHKFNQILLSEYSEKNEKPLNFYSTGSKYKAWWKCQQCGNEWQTRIGHRTNGSGCTYCQHKKGHVLRAKSRKSIQITHPEIAKQWNDIFDINLVSAGSNKKFKWLCEKCNKSYLSTPNRRCNQKSDCPYCAGSLPNENNNLLKLRPDLVQEIVDLDPKNICCYSNKNIKWKCKSCNNVWNTSPNNRTSKKSGCPRCAKKNSKPQQKIEKNLIQYGIVYQKEFKINECKDKRTLPFDFALFNNSNLIGLIEYQGEQHYFPIWGNKNLQNTKKHDLLKIDFCKNQKIPLLEIQYWKAFEIDELISSFINKLFNGL